MIQKLSSNKKNKYQNILRILSSKYIRLVMLILIFSMITSLILASIDQYNMYSKYFFIIVFFASMLFALEYALRLLSAPMEFKANSNFRARIKYVFSFYGMVDFIAILPFVLIFFIDNSENIKESPQKDTVLQFATLLCMFNIFKLIRYSTGFKVIASVFKSIKNELIVTLTTCGFVLLLASIMIFYFEHAAQPDKFVNLGDGLWWSIITFTTIGYGDIVPITMMGRILGGVIGMAGILLIAIPTALISSAFFNIKRKESVNEKIFNEPPHQEEGAKKCPHCNKTLK